MTHLTASRAVFHWNVEGRLRAVGAGLAPAGGAWCDPSI